MIGVEMYNTNAKVINVDVSPPVAFIRDPPRMMETVLQR